ncbi:uncharacterized protein LOC128435137 [Pleuronectes platessa]|uniref:uncharacterized protein LOC128435137 n=1 Tax=Pleuronectes platessa TaxID=8262 RepID=UPI00232A63B0|nr:uncharacterized protein LOC128435137 [Pleuronectes platessa]XP_053273902.1 uncharacterized protein LOC128435137 [Pleuronectes platessa]
MRSRGLFLLIYLLGSCFGQSSANRNESCTSGEPCVPGRDSTSHVLRCVGLPSDDQGTGYVRRLKDVLEAAMDLYSFMKTSVTGVPVLSLQGALELNLDADPMQNEALVQMWLEVKIKPLLRSITKQFLTCLSTKSFSCSTYQTVVRELSLHYSHMEPVRQKWIYSFFMYPFLSGDRVAGCASRNESSEDWLMKNFGAFRGMARLNDLSTLNMVFSGLEVLHLLCPAQKAELLMMPGVQSLDNGTLTLIFHSLLTGGPRPPHPSPSHPPPTMSPGHNWTTPSHNWTTPGHNGMSLGQSWTSPSFTPNYTPQPTYNPVSPHQGVREVVNGFMTAFKPIGSFVHEFVSFTRERNVSEIRSTTLTQFLLNWTLAELADMYRPHNASVSPELPEFDVTDVEDWYKQVVMPVLRRFLPNSGDMMHQNIKLGFHQLFYLDHQDDNETSEIQDVCSITLDKSPCGLTNAVQHVARVLHCVARSNLTMTEETIMDLIIELTKRLNSLMKELSTTDFNQLGSDISKIFSEEESPSMTQQHLQDPEFIKLWFKVKLMPLLPAVPPPLLACLSTKNFSCPVFQTIVAELSNYMSVLEADPMYSHTIYHNFIYPSLLNKQTSDPSCLTANSSAEWLKKTFGFFSRFAYITDFYKLNPNFTGLEVLHLLTPKQITEMLLVPLRTPPSQDVVIDRVFDFLMGSPEQFAGVLEHLPQLAMMVNTSCDVFKQIFVRLYEAVPSLPPDIEPVLWAGIDQLIRVAPEECVPANITCPVTHFNASHCSRVNSSDLEFHLSTSTSVYVSCNFTLEKYACAKLEDFTANQLASLLKCDLPGNSSHSKTLWKMLLTKLSNILDPALDLLANASMTMLGPSALEVLDVIGEIRVSLLTDEQLRNSSEIRKWFSGRLSAFLPSASVRFLRCLGHRNLSCQSYQQILQVFIHHFDHMTLKQQHVVLKNFILPLLSQPHSGPGCVNGSGNSTEWLKKNLGPFSAFLSITELLDLNPRFNAIEALRLLTPKQSAELLVSTRPSLRDKELIINQLFDFLTEAPEQNKIPEFLFFLNVFLQKGNLSCSSFITLFTRVDMALTEVSPDVASNITYSKVVLSKHLPPDCIIYSGNCSVTITNETDICRGVNSTGLQLLLSSGNLDGRLCDFAVEEFACASLSALTAEHLAALLMCSRSSNSSGSRPVWKLLLSKASHVLDGALDLLANKTLDPRNPALSLVLDSIREIRLNVLDMISINHPALVQLWFARRLRPLLSAVSPDFLSCVVTKGLNCTTYQRILQILSQLRPNMTLARQRSVYVNFIKVFLTRNDTEDPSCSLNTNSSGEWLQKNLAGFSDLLSFPDLQMLYANFSALEALPQLTVLQLAQMSSTPGQIRSAAQVNMVMEHVPSRQLAAFFDTFSPAAMAHVNMIPSPVRSAMLQVVFDRADLSSDSVSDSAVMPWLLLRLPPLLVGLLPRHVESYFTIMNRRNCSIEELGVMELNSTISSLSNETKGEIHSSIIQMLRGPTPLRCYGDNYNHSYYIFLESRFMGFQFPNLTTFLSLMPHDKMPQLLNSMPPSHLGDFLRRPDIVDSDAQLCVLFNSYTQTLEFLEKESLPVEVRRPTLPCVWPMALSSSKRSEVNAWFDRSLNNYYEFLTKTLISPDTTDNATCLAFQKVISVLGDYNYTAVDFVRGDVFTSIRSYLHSATVPRCYNSSDPELNSTAWFADYIGSFAPSLTLTDLQAFGSQQVLQVFTVNLENIALFNHSVFQLNFTSYYVELVYLQESNFNPILLPPVFRCAAPGAAFTQLSEELSVIVLRNLTDICTDLDPQISSALAGNFGDNLDATNIASLGNEASSLSMDQINSIRVEVLLASLSVLSTVLGWNEGQARAIIQAIMLSGQMQINSSSTLIMLGSLVMGCPTTAFTSINASELIISGQNSAFLVNLMTAPQIVQQVFVTQIVSVNSNSEAIIENVPDAMATEIPPVQLLGLSGKDSVIKKLNKKKWKKQQVELFFSVIAVETSTAMLGGANNLSSSVLQGFTCTGVRSVRTVQIKKLIKACRRKGKRKVKLVETQLTCMYNYIKGDSDATSFALYPPDVLLYYDYSLVPQASCRSYFEELADADFTVFSSDLSYKRTALFDNARSCLGITTTSLTKDNIKVLGNMCCSVDGSYIVNSDPSILEILKTCPDLTDAQASAAQSLLLSGKTPYGETSTWDLQTLQDLGMIPLYMTSTFYDQFDKKTKRNFLKYFRKILKSNGVSRGKRRTMKKQIRKSIKKKTKRSIESECTSGTITHVTISRETFPFDYDDVTQFNCCLSAATVKGNLEALTEKVDDEEFLAIVLLRLHEAYGDNATIPEDQVQMLGPASRVATVSHISRWSITEVDTLYALMDSSDGVWNTSLAKAVISNYLSNAGNALGSAELNTIGGANLCALDVDVLKNISPQSLKEANALDVSTCSTEKKEELFTIALQAFTTTTRSTAVPLTTYQLISAYLGGTTRAYIQTLVTSNVSMDVPTFTTLNESIVTSLTVSDVQGLLGSNVADLKSYENQTVVQAWTSSRLQSDLDTLSLGLTGGRATTDTTTTNPTTATTVSSSASTSSSPTSSVATTSSSPTSSVATTSSSPTSSVATTSSSPTSSVATTSSSPTSSVATTSSSPTSSVATTSSSPTSSVATTSSSPTSSVATASSSPTSSVATTSSSPTSSVATTSSSATSSVATTSSSPTSSVATTPSSPTSSVATTSSSPTSSVATTSSSPTSSVATTSSSATSSAATSATSSSSDTSSSSPTSSSSSTTVPGTTSTTTTSATTTAHGSRLRADAGFSLFFLLVLFIASQHLVV